MPKKLILDIDDNLWEDFKLLIAPKGKTLNDSVCELIAREVAKLKGKDK